jgi:hypothetical protein
MRDAGDVEVGGGQSACSMNWVKSPLAWCVEGNTRTGDRTSLKGFVEADNIGIERQRLPAHWGAVIAETICADTRFMLDGRIMPGRPRSKKMVAGLMQRMDIPACR